ncbi:MAG: DUF1326 domain-containing protein [Nitrososphaerales archaeon]
MHSKWRVSGTYFEVCNCEAICPCRRQGDRKGGNSTYGECDFLLSWAVKGGTCDRTILSDMNAALSGRYNDQDPGTLWHVILYVDERGDPNQRKCLEDIFLGRAKGTAFDNYASAISEVYSIRRARINLDHTKNKEHIKIGESISVQTRKQVQSQVGVSCGIPGHDQPGHEIIADHFRVRDEPFGWEFEGRCRFATKFSYKND